METARKLVVNCNIGVISVLKILIAKEVDEPKLNYNDEDDVPIKQRV